MVTRYNSRHQRIHDVHFAWIATPRLKRRFFQRSNGISRGNDNVREALCYLTHDFRAAVSEIEFDRTNSF